MERIRKLDKIGSCLRCGVSKHQAVIDRDHFFPLCVARHPRGIEPLEHPLRSVVCHRSNIFMMCRDHHEEIDEKKIKAFGGENFTDLNPVSLVRFLMEEYPITADTRYYDLQLGCMIETNQRFIRATVSLNGEFSEPLKRRYHEAAKLANIFNQHLRKRLYQSQHH